MQPTPPDYIQQSAERVAPKFSEARRLLKIWQDAFRLFLAQPTPDLKELAKHHHAAYKAEQNRALNLFYNTK